MKTRFIAIAATLCLAGAMTACGGSDDDDDDGEDAGQVTDGGPVVIPDGGTDAGTVDAGTVDAGPYVPECTEGQGTVAAGTTYAPWVYTGCACDKETYVKRCGTVNGQEVVFQCYVTGGSGNEEYKPCYECNVDFSKDPLGYYTCASEPVDPIVLERGSVNEVDSTYSEIQVQFGSEAEKHGDQVVEDQAPKFETVDCHSNLQVSGTDGVCETKTVGTKKKYVIQGDVLTKDKVYLGGSVVVNGNKIESVGCLSDGDIADAMVVTCPDAVISAGLINAHEHIGFSNGVPDDWGEERFDHRNDWRTGKHNHSNHNGKDTKNNEVGELRQLMGGATSVFGSEKVNGLLRNVDEDKIEGVSKPTYQTFPLKDSSGDICNDSSIACGCEYYTKYSIDTANYFGPHIGEGINDYGINEFLCLQAKNLFSEKLGVIHGVAATPPIIRDMAKAGSKLIWSPRSNVSLYGDTARVTVYDNMGVTIALGTDWIYSGSGNMLREYECADFLNAYYYDHHFSDFDLWIMGTYNSALALGLEASLGDLAAGKLADISVFAKRDGRTAHRAVIAADGRDVTLVMLDGKPVFGDSDIMGTLAPSSVQVDVGQCAGASKKVDVAATGTTKTYDAIKGAQNYPMFFCGVPDDEPPCVPTRTRAKDTTDQGTTRYDGQFSDVNDRDGDGIPNDYDNCPDVFNPVRPEDQDGTGALGQSDWDGDGVGDVCDAAPLDAAIQ